MSIVHDRDLFHTAYPLDPESPPIRAIAIHVFAGQNVTLKSTVRESCSGQVRVKWTHLDLRGKTSFLYPNGCDNSLTLFNVTTVDSGDYYAVASSTASELISTQWKNANGQHYNVRVEKFGESFVNCYVYT